MIEAKQIIVVTEVINLFLGFIVLLPRRQVNTSMFAMVHIGTSSTSFVIASLEATFISFFESSSLASSEAIFLLGCIVMSFSVTRTSSLTVVTSISLWKFLRYEIARSKYSSVTG